MRFASAVRINGALLPVLFASAKNILVLVGDNNQLAFSPSSVSAALGDNAVFTFMSKNHSVTQSSFANPCQNLPLSPGLESGFQFIADPAATMLFPQWSFNITDVVPLWFFCAQTTPISHCQEVGMVFSINANELGSETFAAFQARAMAAALSTSSAVSSPASSGASSTASSTALTSSTTVTPSNTDSPVVIKKMNLAGPIVGGVVGGLALLVGLGILLFWTRRRRQRSDVAVFRSEILDIEKEPFTSLSPSPR